MKTPDIIAAVSAIAGGISALFAFYAWIQSRNANIISREANKLSRNIAHRQGIVELFNAWQGVSEIETENSDTLNEFEIVKAYNAIDLTSILWNHDVMAKEILYQQYFKAFDHIFRRIDSSEVWLSGKKIICRGLISPEVRRTHFEMCKRQTDGVKQSKLSDD